MDESSCSKSCRCLCMKRCLLTPYYYAKWGIHYGVQGSFQLRSTNNLLRKLEKDQSSLHEHQQSSSSSLMPCKNLCSQSTHRQVVSLLFHLEYIV
ncbi:hypothetical protein PHAVU_007G028600 [Phaseolus vulgaris]|uniref:Uncharacterized protein n=1 Tax=Phaseolus vulgaris TaxID=3885 RepID=V7BDD7_PHAVU|nr:hypothetical protein PHAVU_007G028600g [Phaseolus vulgaris]ESW14918.1 hypothetical protein PHAVU_007G028600g [Phaseolus vulgaris]